MLAIRMQRIGRRGHAQFRVVVQDSRWSPKSGKYVALLGSYNPHTKTNTLVKDQAQTFLNNGAQPSDRVAKMFKDEGLKLPKWISVNKKKSGKAKNPEKLRKNQPAEAKAEQTEATEITEPKDAEVQEVTSEESKEETVAETNEPVVPEAEVADTPEAEKADSTSDQQETSSEPEADK